MCRLSIQCNRTGFEFPFAFPSSGSSLNRFLLLASGSFWTKIRILILTLQNWHLENDRNVLRFLSEFPYKERTFITLSLLLYNPLCSVLCRLLVTAHVYFPLDVVSRDTGSLFLYEISSIKPSSQCVSLHKILPN